MMVVSIRKGLLKAKNNIAGSKVLQVFIAVLVPTYVVDQVAKGIVVVTMSEYEIRWVFPWLHWRYLRNSGAAFSLGESFTLIYTAVMLVVAGGIFALIRKVSNIWWGLGMALVAAGTSGNLTDRLFRQPGWGSGYVVDFISIGDFAVFNIADVAVCLGMALLCFLVVQGVPSGVTLLFGSAQEQKAAHSAAVSSPSSAEESAKRLPKKAVETSPEANVETSRNDVKVEAKADQKTDADTAELKDKTEDEIKAADEVVNAAEEIVNEAQKNVVEAVKKAGTPDSAVADEKEQATAGSGTEKVDNTDAVTEGYPADDVEETVAKKEASSLEQAGEASH